MPEDLPSNEVTEIRDTPDDQRIIDAIEALTAAVERFHSDWAYLQQTQMRESASRAPITILGPKGSPT